MSLIIFVRHGESSANKKHILSDELGVYPLTKLGREQANKTGIDLKKLKINKVFSSPVLRTIQTSEIICKHIKKTNIIDSRLTERRFKEMRGTKVKDNGWKLLYGYKIEPFELLKKRLNSFIKSQEKNSCILAVTHHDPIVSVIASVYDVDQLVSFSFRPTYASITAVLSENGSITPLFFGLNFMNDEAIKKIPKKYKW